MTYATDGRCHNSNAGTFNHECGKPATWVGTNAKGFRSGYCDHCKQHGDEGRRCVAWEKIEAPARYRIVTNIDGKFSVVETTDVAAWAAAAGVEIVGRNVAPQQRAQLQGQPKLKSFLGPMWDGDAVRYEDQRSYDILSA